MSFIVRTAQRTLRLGLTLSLLSSSVAHAQPVCVGATCRQFSTITSKMTASLGRLPDDLRFDLSVDDISTNADAVVARLTAAHNGVADVALDRVSWAAVVAPLLDTENALHAVSASLVLPMYVHTDK